MDFDISVEVSRLYVSFFNRAADPEGLQYWVKRYNHEVAAGRDGKMFLEDMADSFAQSPEAKAIYETTASPTDAEIKAYIAEAYMNMFGRTPDDEGLDYWAGRWKTEMDQGKPGVRVLFEIENAARNSTNQNDVDALKNKAEVAAKFTNDFVASGADWKSEDMASAKSIVDKVDHTPASVTSANEDITKFIEEKTNPDGGQEPGGGDPDGGNGGGPVVPDPLPAASIANGVISIAAGTEVTLSENNGVLTLSRPGFYSVAFNEASVAKIDVADGAKVNVASTGSFAKFAGDGVVNITGVVIAEATASAPIDYDLYVRKVYDTGVTLQVNADEAATIKAIWDLLDDRYNPSSAVNDPINEAFVRLGVRYVEYLEEGGTPFTDFSAKVSVTRDQSMHDNLLGNLNSGSLESRFSGDKLSELKGLVADAYEARQIFDGDAGSAGGVKHDAVRAFDYAKGWARPDYLDVISNGKIDPDGIHAIAGKENMFSGSGNLVTNFNVVRHEGLGLEIALKAKPFAVDPGTYSADLTDKIPTYSFSEGTYQDQGARAIWSFDWSITTHLNNNEIPENLDFVLYIDTDRTADVSLKKVTIGESWIGSLDENWNNDSDLLKEDAPKNVFQNSWNFAFAFLQDMFGEDGYDFGPGLFDIKIAAEVDGAEIFGNTIRVDVVGASVQTPIDVTA